MCVIAPVVTSTSIIAPIKSNILWWHSGTGYPGLSRKMAVKQVLLLSC